MRHLPRRLAPLAVLCTGLGFVAVAVAPAASADTVTQYFAYNGGEQTFSVPNGVTSVHVVAVGGHGGESLTNLGDDAANGGPGATVTADLDVSGIPTLYVEVGGNGQDAAIVSNEFTHAVAGGFNGGGVGAGQTVGQTSGFDAGGGGGASDVRTSPRAGGGSLGTRLLVAGGGGGGALGAAGGSSGVNGSAGGNGPDGASADDSCKALGGDGGGGGGQSIGGSAGSNPGFDFTNAQGGALGAGGYAGYVDGIDAGGGGGGGGLFGGGGGGGSSYFDPALAPDATTGTDASGTPSITISYVVPHKPQAATEPASDIGYGSVTLNGVVNPEGCATNYQFEIRNTGTTGWHLLGSAFPAGSDSTQVAVSYAYSGVVPATGYDYQLVTTNCVGETDGGIQSFTTQGGPPAVTTTPASAVGQTSATLNGVVDPDGLNALYWFDYGTSPSYGTQSVQGGEGGSSQVPVQTVLTNLTPGTTYYFRLHASNLAGQGFDAGLSFTTLPASPAPSVTTKAATGVGQHGATLNGSVNPHGAATTYFFQYGTTTSYGSSTPSVSAGSGNAAKAVHALLAGLPRHTTFHFRLVATSANGTTNGLDKTFRTT